MKKSNPHVRIIFAAGPVSENPCFLDRALVFIVFIVCISECSSHPLRIICGCSLDKVEVESSLPLWVELVCMEAAVDQEDTSHNHSYKEVEDLRRIRQNLYYLIVLCTFWFRNKLRIFFFFFFACLIVQNMLTLYNKWYRRYSMSAFLF